MKRSEEKLAAQRIVFPEADYKIICERRRFCENDRAFHEEIEIKYYLSGSSALVTLRISSSICSRISGVKVVAQSMS